MASSRRGAENVKGVTGHINTLHQRLYHALDLGTRGCDDKDRKWRCTDIGIQRHVVRSMAAFLDCFPRHASQNPLLMDSVADMTGALAWILKCRNEAVVNMAAVVAVKLIGIIPKSLKQLYALDFLSPLSSLLNFHQIEASISVAKALNMILMSINENQEKKVWMIIEESKTIVHVVSNIRDFSSGTMSIEYFYEMASLLSTLLLRWPPARYRVYNDASFMNVMEDVTSNCDICIRVGALKLYSALALCGDGARKLLEAGKLLLKMMLCVMNESCTQNARIEAFKLAEHLATDEKRCSTMINMCCEPLVKAIIHGMGGWILHPVKSMNEQMPLLLAACRLALIVQWPGEHQSLFWKNGITKVLLYLLQEDIEGLLSDGFLSLEEQISIAQKVLDAKFLFNLRPYVWDILGWLAIHSREDLKPSTLGNEHHVDFLIACACLAFLGSVQKGHQIRQDIVNEMSSSEAASRVALFLIHSPCRYIASKTRCILSGILKASGDQHVKPLIRFLHHTSNEKIVGQPILLQSAICLVGLACYSGLEQYWKHMFENNAIKVLLSFSLWCLRNHVRVGRSSLSSHLQNPVSKRICCEPGLTNGWDDNDVLLLYSLWAIDELLSTFFNQSGSFEQLSDGVECVHTTLAATLQEVRDGFYAPGPRMHATRILSYFQYYGFPSKFGKRVGEAYRLKEFGDLQLVLADGDSLTVHKIVLAVRCPSLLPLKGLDAGEKKDFFSQRDGNVNMSEETLQEIRLSSRVDRQALSKVLEFVYTGYVEVEEQLAKKLKTLTKHCKVQSLLQMLARERPKWGSSIPCFDLSPALGPLGSQFSDIILEAKKPELKNWTCSICSLSQPHVHAHKVILWSSCEYLRALFQSGMQESRSQTLKVPIGFKAMIKLVNWFYADKLPSPPSGCRWSNMGFNEKLEELQSYVEIYWLSEFWILEVLRDVCGEVIESRLDSASELCVKIIKLAGDFGLWDLATVVAEHAAPIYHKLRDAGELEELEEGLADMLRSASVRLSQRKRN